MTSPRKHPTAYPQDFRNTVDRVRVVGSCCFIAYSAEQANALRSQIYAYRECLRLHPEFYPEVLKILNKSKVRKIAWTTSNTSFFIEVVQK